MPGVSLKSKIARLPGYNSAVLPLHYFRAAAAASKNNYPAAGMTVIGVTGTNGKSTTAAMIFEMLRAAGKKVGILSTVEWGTWEDVHPETAHLTTASPALLNKRIAEMRGAGVEWLVLEVSSHALAQGRIFGIPIDTAVFTNLTREHLDYHRTMARYRAAKMKLFRRAKFSVINADDPNWNYFSSVSKKYITYGIKNGDYRAKKLKLTSNYIKYDIIDAKNGRRTAAIEAEIPGEFNVYNSLAAATVGFHYGLSRKEVEDGIRSLKSVEGRMNKVDAGQPFSVIVDYAHTPDAFEKVLSIMRATTKGKLIVMFGMSGGNRDASLREPVGKVAGTYADAIVLTEDDPRDEKLEKIWGEIEAGIEDKKMKIYHEAARSNGMRKAFSLAGSKNDTVALLGMGHQKVIERADGEHKWNELEAARRILSKMKMKK
jgi:UDP-N-acetylmuramoyl-L-alanyl-D-glutamate--2,6-diaminopimelate ligase